MLYLLTGLFFLSSASAEISHLPLPEIETLPNGLQVAWFLNSARPGFDLSLVVKAGYRDDLPGKSGTAELLARVLELGKSRTQPSTSADQEAFPPIEKNGGSSYVSVFDDTFVVGVHGLAVDADFYLSALSHYTLQPNFPEKELQREKSRLADRWNHLEDFSETLVNLVYHYRLAAGTHYGRGNLLTVAELKKVERDDLLNFYKNHFTPVESILMVIGRVDQLKFREKIVAQFGQWQGSPAVRSWKTYTHFNSDAGQVLFIDRPGLTQAQIKLGFRGPSVQAPERYALIVANSLLGEYFNSRLNATIRDQYGLTYAIRSSFTYNKDYGEFAITSSTQNNLVEPLIKKTTEVLEQFKNGAIDEKEVEIAKGFLAGAFPLSLMNPNAIAARWLEGAIFNLGPNFLNEFFPKLQAVTLEDVKSAVEKDFDLKNLVVVVAGDEKEIRKHLSPNFTVRKILVSELK